MAKNMTSFRLLRISVLVSLCVSFIFLTSTVYTQQSSSSISQSFKPTTDNGQIETGALVSFKTNDSHSIELTTAANANRMVGVADASSLLVLSGEQNTVDVVLGGTTNVLVSDINGPIKASDKITISPIAGVGMRATRDSQVVGTARSDFDTANSRTHQITDSNGTSHTVHIGYLPLQVGIAYYRAPGSEFMPPFVQNIADSIAGRPVSLIRIILCGTLLITSFITIAMLIYSSVRTSMISLGRNPLAASAIRKSLYQVATVAIIVAIGTLLASYIILAA